MLKNLKKKNEGFTIIEVLIVLAIAGLILLIVFLAVPALQRNSRTTQLKNASAAILGVANEYVSNNNGQQPGGCSIGPDGTITISGTGTPVTGKTQAGYTCNFGGGAKTAGNPTGAFNLNINSKCNGAAIQPAPRAIAVTFTVETSGSTIPQCVET